MNYKETVLTPRTDFPMRAGLVKNEPDMQKRWSEQDLYQRIREARKDGPEWILHDGPPYANGSIHIGHALNKVLKDIVVKYRTMTGCNSPYIPGWDCHGLPIEHKIMSEHKDRLRDMSPTQIRQLCRDHAETYIKMQREQFERLGVFADYDHPYLTMNPEYEAAVLGVFAGLVEQDLVYRQLKPVHWCIDCGTALAEAELEYENRKDNSIYVDFPLSAESAGQIPDLPSELNPAVMIWTTTPWTLPANMAVAVHPEFDYVAVRYTLDGQSRCSIVAAGLLDEVMKRGGVEDAAKIAHFKGSDMVGWTYQHPFLDRVNPVLAANYVTLRDDKNQPTGTGLVHTAPGHGADDYFLGKQNHIETYSPVLGNGTFDDSVPDWIQGKSVWAGNDLICDRLITDGYMFKRSKFEHSYPHCWRSKSPTIFRCTEQWFINVTQPLAATGQGLRDMATAAVPGVQWVPNWGRSRIEGMLSSRPDWCISRQRAWGLPIPAFYDKDENTVLTAEIVRAAAAHFREHGSDSWFTDSPAEILKDCPLPNGLSAADLQKENDIFDVWFESGSSWAAVCQAAGWTLPIDLYLEGSDQHRGWFQLSLLPALGVLHKAPFKTVLTHGFVVDENGRKMSKARGNVVDPQKEIAKYGADVVRLWVASIDYQNDMRCSDNLIKSLQDEYRKVRNTIRFCLGSLHDFDPEAHAVHIDQNSIDAWAMFRLHDTTASVSRLFEEYAFYKLFKQIHDFCNLDLSQIYFVAIKDRLYCDRADSQRRRRCQTVLHHIVDYLVRMVAPILVHTAEEAWSYLPARSEDLDSVHLAHFPLPDPKTRVQRIGEDWSFVLKLREDAMMQLEKMKREDGMTNALDARAIYCVNEAQQEMLTRYDDDVADVLGVSSHVFRTTGEEPRIIIEDVRELYQKCARSWKRREDVGQDPEFPDLTLRDAHVMRHRAAQSPSS